VVPAGDSQAPPTVIHSTQLHFDLLVSTKLLTELELARQAETSYQRMVQDQLAGRPARVGASATPERA